LSKRGAWIEDNYMRTCLLTMCLFALGTSLAHAEDHGHIAVQIKTPPAGCKYLKLNFVDENGKKFSPSGNTIGMSEIDKKERRGKFTDIHKFHVKPGQHTLKGIECINLDKTDRIGTTVHFKTLRKTELPPGITQSNFVFEIVPDKTIYMGALDFIRFGRDNAWPLALDRSQKAVQDGRLEAGTFVKQFVTLKGDMANAKLTNTDMSALNDILMPKTETQAKPPPGGKGKIAVHYTGSRCSPVEIFFKNVDQPDSKSIRIKIKNMDRSNVGFGTEKVPSGRYEFSSTKCTFAGRYTIAPALAKSFVDVYDNEIAYAGEIYRKTEITMGVGRDIGSKYRYIFNNDKFGLAKDEVKKPERLVDRSATMTDAAQLAISGIQNYMDRTNANMNSSLSAYQARLAEYADEVVP